MKGKWSIFYFFVIFLFSGCTQAAAELPEQEKQMESLYTTKQKESEDTRIIKNNGGSIIQVQDLIYYIAPDNNSIQNQDAVYSMNLDGTNQKKLFDVGFTRELYAMDRFLFTSYYNESGKEVICRYSIDTGEWIEFAEGSLDYVDNEKKEIYYSHSYPSEGFVVGSWDLWKMDSEGKNHTPIASDCTFIKKVGNVIYLEKFDRSSIDVVLASVKDDGTDFKILAEIPHWNEKFSEKEYIFSFAVCGDWILLNRGSYQGNIGDYCGGLVRLKKDGSELEQLPFQGEGNIKVFDDWIYFDHYRFRPDSTEKEWLGEQKGWSFGFSEGYLHYLWRPEENKEGINHFYQYDIEQNHTIKLFDGNDAPFFKDSVFIDYKDRETVGDYLYFGVEVYGYTEKDTWRGHTCAYRYYRIQKDGSGLQLIYEDKTKKCPDP